MNQSNNSNIKSKEIYGIPGSGWTSPEWNWGYAVGTGHDCALICRRKFSSKQARKELIGALLHPTTMIGAATTEEVNNPPFEEVKLILGLTIQRGRWDGTDGGRKGYSEVLYHMAQAERYESSDEELNAQLFVQDMNNKFHLIAKNEFDDDYDGGPSVGDSIEMMQKIMNDHTDNYDLMRRKCTSLVLLKMGFIPFGL